MKIKMIEIEYFRGIKHKLDLDFLHGKELKSIGIYGRNGSGKSSIVDGWEWMSSNVHRIGHLSREGVSEKDYPHKLCNSQECYLKIDFETDSTKTFKFVFNHKLTTQPKINGDYDLFKSFIKYPCHLRFGDLREFVYFTKAQKYEYLGKLLGLDDPLIVQGQLFSFLNKLKVWLESLNEESVKNESKLTDILKIDGYEEIELIKKKNDIAKKYEFPETDNLKDFKWLLDNLTELMSKDPITQKLFDWKEIQVIINSFYPITSIKDNLESLEEYYTKVKANEESIKAIALIKLYETGKSIIEKNEDKDICPLCDRPFEGDLLSHIELKHGELQELTNNKKKYDSMREEIRKGLEKLKYKIKVIENYKNKEIKKDLKSFFDFFDGLNSKNESSLSFVGKDIVETKEVEVLLKEVNEIITNLKLIEDEIKNIINKKITELSDNEKRKELSSTVILINN